MIFRKLTYGLPLLPITGRRDSGMAIDLRAVDVTRR